MTAASLGKHERFLPAVVRPRPAASTAAKRGAFFVAEQFVDVQLFMFASSTADDVFHGYMSGHGVKLALAKAAVTCLFSAPVPLTEESRYG